jgi:hypothetical protein
VTATAAAQARQQLTRARGATVERTVLPESSTLPIEGTAFMAWRTV